MRRQVYDDLCIKALNAIKQMPTEEQEKPEILDIYTALECVLTETDEIKINQFYHRIDEFYSVNPDKGLEYLSGKYLLTGAY